MKRIDKLLAAMTVDEKIDGGICQVPESGAAKDIRAGIVSFGTCQAWPLALIHHDDRNQLCWLLVTAFRRPLVPCSGQNPL